MAVAIDFRRQMMEERKRARAQRLAAQGGAPAAAAAPACESSAGTPAATAVPEPEPEAVLDLSLREPHGLPSFTRPEFDVGQRLVPGASRQVVYMPDFLSTAETAELMKLLYSPAASERWGTKCPGMTAPRSYRRTQNWGGRPGEHARDEGDLPRFAQRLIDALVARGVYAPGRTAARQQTPPRDNARAGIAWSRTDTPSDTGWWAVWVPAYL